MIQQHPQYSGREMIVNISEAGGALPITRLAGMSPDPLVDWFRSNIMGEVLWADRNMSM